MESNKVKFILSALKILQDDKKGHKVLIFSQSRPVLFSLVWVLQREGFFIDLITGGGDVRVRQPQIDRFNRTDLFMVLLLSSDAMSEGVQLQGADTVIFHDHSDNPQKDNQAEARAYRTKQTKPVLVLRLFCGRESVEYTRTLPLLESKRKIQFELEYDKKIVQYESDAVANDMLSRARRPFKLSN